MRLRAIALFAAMLALACLDGATAPPAPSADTEDVGGIAFYRLQPGDAVRVTFASDGCFHHLRLALTVLRDTVGAQLIVDSLTANLAPGWHLKQPARLSEDDLIELDRLLAFYRSTRHMGCTTVDSISLRTSGPGPLLHESYVDGSCATYEKDLLTIPRLYPLERDSVGPPPNEEL